MRNKTSLSRKAVLLAFGLPVLLIVLLPLCALVASTSPASFLQYIGDELTQKALKLSVISSLISTGLILFFGTPLALLIARSEHGFLNGFLNLTLVIPPAVAGLGLLMLLGQHGVFGGLLGQFGIQIPLTITAVILAQCFVACPYFIKSAAASLAAVPSRLKDAARLEGASGFQIFLHVTFPLVWRGFLAGAAMSWARGLGEFGATLIFAGNLPGRTQTLPLAIISNLGSTDQRALVISVVLLGISFALLLIVQSLGTRAERAAS